MSVTPAYPPNNCGSCNGKHWSPREVAACAQFGPAVNYRPPSVVVADPITDRQLDYIRRLNGDATYAAKLTKRQASDYIDSLLKGNGTRVAANTANPASAPADPYDDPNKGWTLRTPKAMVENTPDGRYAVRHDENEAFKFVRIVRPKHGKKKGALVLQTQHSDFYKDCVIVWPSGQTRVYDNRIDPFLLLVVADPITGKRRYGQELGRCCDCGRELTDGRSIWYGIGPECEKRNQDIIDAVVDEKGPYTL